MNKKLIPINNLRKIIPKKTDPDQVNPADLEKAVGPENLEMIDMTYDN